MKDKNCDCGCSPTRTIVGNLLVAKDGEGNNGKLIVEGGISANVTPTAPSDLATKGYVDSVAGGAYELPPATKFDLGGVIVGKGLEVDEDGQISTRQHIYNLTEENDLDIGGAVAARPGDIAIVEETDNVYLATDSSTTTRAGWTLVGNKVRGATTYLVSGPQGELACSDAQHGDLTYNTTTGKLKLLTGTVPALIADWTELSIVPPIASTSGVGGVVVGDGLSINPTTGELSNAYTYTLPTAASDTLGGIKVGSGLSIDGSGVLSATYSYSLPTASSDTLGGVKVGSGLAINDGVLSATYSYSLPTASADTLGGIKVGSGLAINDGVLSNAYSYTLPTAASDTLGGIKVGSGLSIDNNGVLSATYSYSLPTAGPSTLGGVKVGNSLDISGQGVLNAKPLTPLFSKEVSASSTGMVTLEDFGTLYTYTPSGDSFINFNDAATSYPTGTVPTFELEVSFPTTAYTLTFSVGTLVWLNDEAPDMSEAGKVYLLAFRRRGNYWLGNLQGSWTIPSSNNG